MDACCQYKLKNKNCLQTLRYRWPFAVGPTPSPSSKMLWTTRTVHTKPQAHAQNHVDSVDSQVSRQAGYQGIVHKVHMGLRGQNASGQSVDTVDTLDVRFKSPYPFCLFFKQGGFSFNDLYYPQYPQSIAPLCSAWFAAWVKPPFFRYPPRVHNIHKRSGVKRSPINPHNLLNY